MKRLYIGALALVSVMNMTVYASGAQGAHNGESSEDETDERVVAAGVLLNSVHNPEYVNNPQLRMQRLEEAFYGASEALEDAERERVELLKQLKKIEAYRKKSANKTRGDGKVTKRDGNNRRDPGAGSGGIKSR